MNDDYVLKSSKEDVAGTIRKAGVMFGKEADDAAEMILKYCPKHLYPNIDEIVNEKPITDIYFDIELNGRIYKKTVNSITDDFYVLKPIVILIGICMELKGEYGFAWLDGISM